MESKRISATVVAMAVLSVLMGPWTVTNATAGLTASDPKPADGEIGVTIPLFRWTAGDTALFHDVYLGTDPNLGPDDLVQSRLPMTLYYHVRGLEPGITYFWRVDEIEADMTTVHTGDLWSFTTLPYTASAPHPPDGATSVDPEVELTWTPGERAVAHEVYFGTDPATVIDGARGTFMGSQIRPTYDPGTLYPGTTYYWRIDEVAPDGVRYAGPMWSFTTSGAPGARTYYVDGNTGSDLNDGRSPGAAFATIRRGIEAASDGDTVLVSPGVYHEPIDFVGKAIAVRGRDGAAVLDVGDDFAVSFYMGEGPATVLENFIIQNSFIGIFLVQSSPTIRNVTVVHNKYGVEAYAEAEPDISNCIFWYNAGDDLFGCQVRYSCVERHAEGTGNFGSDPLFADPNADDYHLLSERGRYWPEHDVWVLDKISSPCLDAGDPNADYSGEPLPNGGRINLGAYGGTAFASLCEGGPVLNEPPHVLITVPADGTGFSLSQTVEIRAEAWDVDGVVVSVEFFANGEKIGEDIDGSDGWTLDWTVTSTEQQELIARATDNEGATTDSAPIAIYRYVTRRR